VPTRVLIADDHSIVREGMRALLTRQKDLEVVGEAADGGAAVAEALRLRPDVVVMDLSMPALDGVEATRRIRREAPEVKVLVLSMHGSDDHVRPAVRAGASGFLLKGAGLDDLVAAVRAVAKGGTFFRVPVSDHPDVPEPERPSLTPRELEILRLVAEGRSSAAIAKQLALSIKTVEAHRSRMMQKLDVTNAAGLIRHATKLGIL
jgi:DNA-binding NarL/FixJ family response regulator